MHHLHVRKRVYKNVDVFPSPDSFKRFLDKAMYVVGLISPIAFLPQVLDVYASHNVSSLSLITWTVLALVNVLWTLYGWVHKEYAIFIANAFMAVLQIFLIGAIVIYR